MLNDITSIYSCSLSEKKPSEESLIEMYGRHLSGSSSSGETVPTTTADSRLAVADILSTMANGNHTDNISPNTYVSLEGFSSGILTQTTPTLTPTTLRNIEQTFFELQSVPPTQLEHQNQAGFVPPVVHRTQPPAAAPQLNSGSSTLPQAIRSTQPSTAASHSYPNMPPKTLPATSSDSWSNNNASSKSRNNPAAASTTSAKTGRNMGGRKPSRNEKLSPEEEERRRVRRERNKMAAARCRKRRMDHTNLLVNETNMLEDKRSELQNEIQLLQTQKEELEFLLETHKVVCKIAKHHHHHLSAQEDIKPNIEELNRALIASNSRSTSSPYSSSTSTVSTSQHYSNQQQHKENNWGKKTPLSSFESKSTIQRPNSLPLTSTFATPNIPSIASNQNFAKSGSSSITEATGISISTPSSGIFNFDALMEGGTGLTPIIGGSGLTPMIPTCSTQQRSSSSDLSSPDTITPSKLVSL